MRRALFIALMFAAATARAGMHVGLANAVAKESDSLIDQAVEEDRRAAVGDLAAQNLPSCGASAPYSLLPTDLSSVTAIVPLGAMNPPAHTFPTDHIYFYLNPLDPLNPGGPRATTPLFAPGDILVTMIATTEYLSASPPFIDYGVYFYGCREVKSYYSHIQLDPSFSAKVGAIDQNCTTYTTGGSTLRRCQESMAVPISTGERIGSSGAPYAGAFDFGTYDYRVSRPLLVPTRRGGDTLHTVCPVDYFSTQPRQQMESLMGRFDGGFQRTVGPVCGEIVFDVAGSARGLWWKPGAPDNPEDPHLALVPNNVDPTMQNISCGTSVAGMSGAYAFIPTSAGRVNRDFAQVTPDGNVYCYDSFYDPIGQPGAGTFRILISLPTSTTVQFERDASSLTCGSGPWSLSGAAVTFQR